MNCPKLGRTTRFLLAMIVFVCISPTVFMSPAVLFGQDLADHHLPKLKDQYLSLPAHWT